MKRYLLPLLVIVFLVFGITVAYIVTQKTTFLKNNAAISTGTGTITLTPTTVTHYVGESFATQVKINTGGAAIAGVSFRLTYPYTGTTPELDVVDTSGVVSNKIVPDSTLLGTGDWAFSVNSVTRANNTVTIDFSAIDTNITGFSTTSDINLATIYFKANRAASTNPVLLSFDTTQSTMQTKSNPTDILKTPTNGSYTIIADNTAPSAITDLHTTSVTATSVNIAWTAPSDSGPLGKATSYDVRYSISPITAANWSTATLATGMPTPGAAGSAQSMAVNGLSGGTTYYFAIKSTDSNSNISNLSNVINANTTSLCTTNNPTISANPPTQTGRAGSSLTYTITVQNNNTGTGCANDSVTIGAQLPSSGIWSVAQSPGNPISIATGASTQVSLTINSDSQAASQNYIIPVTATRSGSAAISTNITFVVNNILFTSKFKLQGVAANGLTFSNFDTTFKNVTTGQLISFTGNASSGTSGVFTYGPSDRTSMAAGTYDISIKEPYHLRKALRGVNLNYGSNISDYTATPLKAGDFDNNNLINITDVSLILSQYTALIIPVTPNNQKYDVNRDNVINITDIAIILSNYTALTVNGDSN